MNQNTIDINSNENTINSNVAQIQLNYTDILSHTNTLTNHTNTIGQHTTDIIDHDVQIVSNTSRLDTLFTSEQLMKQNDALTLISPSILHNDSRYRRWLVSHKSGTLATQLPEIDETLDGVLSFVPGFNVFSTYTELNEAYTG